MLMESHIGLVMVNDSDPDKSYAVECRIDTLLPGETYPVLIKPLFAPNGIKIPDVNVNIEVIIPHDDEHGFPGERDLGQLDFVEEIYYTDRLFDTSPEGKVPQELLTNYPKRAGLLWDLDGTIIYYDSSDGNIEFRIKLTDGKTFLSLKPDHVTIQQDTIKWELKDKKMITTVDGSELGVAGASKPYLLGDIVHQAISDLVTAWLSAVTTLGTPPADPTGAKATAYGSAMITAVGALQATLANWKSTKHFLNG